MSSTTKPPSEQRSADSTPAAHSSSATSTALGQGDTGPLKERDISASDAENYSRSELEGEQMRAPGEGEVARAVEGKAMGGHGEEPSLTEDMEAQAARHADALRARDEPTAQDIEQQDEDDDWTGRRSDVDVAEALGGRDTGVVLAVDESA